MVLIRHIRLTIPFSEEQTVQQFLSLEKNLYYVYGMEISKKSKIEHFHITLKSDYSSDTITRKLKKIFNLTSTEFSNTEVKDTIKSIAYTLKDGNYNIHWDNDDEIEQAKQYMENVQDEQKFKNLKDKCINYLNTLDDIHTMMNTSLLCSILKWFKEKELTYPSKAWINQTMVTYYMQEPDKNYGWKNIETLYGIRDAFIE